MRTRLLCFVLVFFMGIVHVLGQLQSPFDFLNTGYGQHFTPHHELVNYVKYVSENSNRVQMVEYGHTNQDRPLVACYISTPENLANLEQIRTSNLANIGMIEQPSNTNEKALVWLSFGVHGNEAGASESSMNVLYKLANESNNETGEWLKNTVVILDPSINPDGYSRYTHWVRNISGKMTHPGHSDREHMEPWPGGRVNHYMFDLNRDWAWQTQLESRQRVSLYNKWMPHIHVDFHEMGYNDHYYFAPAAEPYHPFISDFQREFQVDIGKNHAKHFDKEGWLYFTRETFDLFYPSYGDTYPMFNGAIGMTHEKAGHGMAGRAIQMNNGDTLKLIDRINHHTSTGLSTIESASANAKRLIGQFGEYFDSARKNPKGKYKTYILKHSKKVNRLAELLTLNDIEYGFADESGNASGYSYYDDKVQSFAIEKGDMIVQVDQPKSILTQIFFEPSSELSDSLTYDITAWALPFAYGIETYATTAPLITKTTNNKPKPVQSTMPGSYAYVVPWGSVDVAATLSKLYHNDISVRRTNKQIQFPESKIEPGSLIITRGDNKKLKQFDKEIQTLLGTNVDYFSLASGFSSNGGDLGGSSFTMLTKPKVLLLSGSGTSANEVGQVWYYFDEVIKYPLSIVDIDNFDRIDLSDFNTIILPDGWYTLGNAKVNKLSSWVGKGGKLIAVSGALRNFNEKEGWGLAKFATDDEKSAASKDAKAKKLAARLHSYEDRERRGISGSIPGAIFENEVDQSYPLSFGLGDKYFSLKTGRQYYKLLKGMWNPIYVPSDYRHIGFVGSQVKDVFKETSSFAVESKGRGKVVYMIDNPLYRGFWENGLLLFSNAVLLLE